MEFPNVSVLDSSGMNISLKKIIYRGFSYFLFLSFLYYFLSYFNRHRSEMPLIEINVINLSIFIFFIFLMFLSNLLASIAWKNFVDKSNELRTIQFVRIFFISQFAKYLPGNIGHYIGRAVLSRTKNISYQSISSSLILEFIWLTFAGLFLASYGIFIYELAIPDFIGFSHFYIYIYFFVFLFLPWVSIFFINSLLSIPLLKFINFKTIIEPNIKIYLINFIIYILCFLIFGLIIKLLIASILHISDLSFFFISCLFSLCWLIGFIIPGAPAGIGVRESAIIYLFSPIIGAGPSLSLSIILRLITLTSDALIFLFGYLIKNND